MLPFEKPTRSFDAVVHEKGYLGLNFECKHDRGPNWREVMGPFRKLLVWQKAHRLTLQVYRITRSFPVGERYGLTAQMRRTAASIGANIAEGSARKSDKDFARFAQIAFGSASELEQHLLLAVDLEYLRKEQHAELDSDVNEVKRMLTGLCRRLTADGRRLTAR